MKRNFQKLFIEENYREAQRIYAESLEGLRQVWDYVAITASSERQAEGYRKQLEYRLAHGMLPSETKYIVVADPMGKRVGSGGACLNVLREIAGLEYGARKVEGRLFEGIRILCIHSGGDSKRVPQYSVCGKLFAPMPRKLQNGLSSSLFDEIMLTACAFPEKMTDGMLTCSGDVLLLFDPQKMEYFSGGASAISVKTDAAVGSAHGVYKGDGSGRVGKFLHKQTVGALASHGAIDLSGQVAIDTGSVLFDSEILRRLYTLVDTEEKFLAVVNDRVRLSFYADFSYPLSSEASLRDYLCQQPEGDFTPELEKIRERIWTLLSEYNMRLTVFPTAEFLHFGTTAELRALVTEELFSYGEGCWDRFINTDVDFMARAESSVSVNCAVIADDAEICRGTYIENSYIGAGACVGEGCVISCSNIPNNAVIPPNTAVSTVKTVEGYVARVYAVTDDPKKPFHFGRPIASPLWSAHIFPVCDTPEEAIAASLEVFWGDGSSKQSGKLTSMEESFYNSESDVLSERKEHMLIENTRSSFLSLSAQKAGFYRVQEVWSGLNKSIKDKMIGVLSELAADETVCKVKGDLVRARLNAYLYGALGKSEYLERSIEAARQSVINEEATVYYALTPVCDEVTVNLPVRVNFAGGWTDTPPFCIEKGGTVLNAAVTLDDSFPISATVRRIPKRAFVLTIADSEEQIEISAEVSEELLRKCRPVEPFAVHKAAILASGLIRDCADGRTVFDALGGGLELSTQVRNIPKGSGLGTSSILLGALISALYRFFGRGDDNNVIWRKVLLAEQYMCVGGGWQDQVGGMTPGIKLLRSEVGSVQRVSVQPLNISDEVISELESRLVLIYTGQRREAKDIIRQVIWRYLAGIGDTVAVLCDMRTLAERMTKCLENGDIDGFAILLNESCESTERLYDACTNQCIDGIFGAIRDLVCGRMICGAGGGGYLQAVLKRGVTPEELQKRIYDVFGECEIKVQQFRFVRDLPR